MKAVRIAALLAAGFFMISGLILVQIRIHGFTDDPPSSGTTAIGAAVGAFG